MSTERGTSPPLVVTVDVEGRTRSDGTVDYGPVDRVAGHVDRLPCPFTLFVTPDVVEERPGTVASWIEGPNCVGLHLHPARLTGGPDRLDEYDRGTIEGLLVRGAERLEESIGYTPAAFRAGRWAYSDRLLDALEAQGFERDASLRPSTPTDPYRRGAVAEYPLTVYGNRLVEFLLWSFGVDAVGLHADAYLRTRPRALLFRLLARWLVHSDRPYLMVAYHDYDLRGRLGERIERYVRRLAAALDATTVGALGRPSREHGTG